VFLSEAGDFDDTDAAQQREQESHVHYTHKLAGRIESWAQEHDKRLQVRSFLMDLRGDVQLLEPAS
jgi:hypothetical protein